MCALKVCIIIITVIIIIIYSTANNPANHPANHAALKIQRWFRHSRQERVFKEAMSEIQILDDRTDDILQKIRKEEERIRVCNTPTDSPAGHSGNIKCP